MSQILRAFKAILTQVLQDRDATIVNLESRLQKLEQSTPAERRLREEQAVERERQAEAQRQRAEELVRANLLNPACLEFWTSRRYTYGPWEWSEFKGTQFQKPHAWPHVIATFTEAAYWQLVPNEWLNHKSPFVQVALKRIFDDDDLYDDSSSVATPEEPDAANSADC